MITAFPLLSAAVSPLAARSVTGPGRKGIDDCMMTGRSREPFLRFAERRRREDEASRLHADVPELRALRLEIEEHRGDSPLAETRHVRHVVIARAPALFVVPCGDTDCRDGGHDVTEAVMQGLGEGVGEFVVEHECGGDLRGARCGRVVCVRAAAGYSEE
jgi:hypothetical protein